MDLTDFVKTALVSLCNGVDQAKAQVINRNIQFKETEGGRTIEFDIAVSAQNKRGAGGKAEVKVWQIAEGGGSAFNEKQNSTISRIKFGLIIDRKTEDEKQADAAKQGRGNAAMRSRQKLKLHL